MKRTFIAAVMAISLGWVSIVVAEDKGKEITIKGQACCAKCALKEKDSCQNAVTVEKDGKKTVYYLVQNDISKGFHKNVCTEAKAVSVVGTCKRVDGKLEVTASKIELSK